MLFALKRLSLGLTLIASASGVLLLMDLHRRAGGAQRLPEIAVLQHASVPVLDDGVRGMIDGLAAMGYRDGATAAISRYNAEGDAATANAIAREITDGHFDLVINMSGYPISGLSSATEWRVRDPIGGTPEQYRETRDHIEQLVMKLILDLRRKNNK